MIPVVVASGLFDIAKGLIDKLLPDPAANAAAQLELMRLDQNGQLQELQTRMSAILAEAQSQDPWTSRARPMFLYVFYCLLTFMVMVGPMIGLFLPEKMELFFMYVGKGFNALPEELWWTFSAGYLGYTGAKTFEKSKGIK